MSRRSQSIIFGVTGQSLIWDATEGQAGSVTGVTVYQMGAADDAQTESATTGTAAIDSVNTTVSVASGLSQTNPRLLTLTSTTGIVVGRQYLVTNAGGQTEIVEVEAVTSTQVTARDPLANDYAAGATFQGCRLTIGLSSTWVADKSKITDDQDAFPGYRVRWVYVVGGVTYVHDSDFDLVRYPKGHTLLPADVEAMYPGYRQRLPGLHQGDEGRRLLEEAYEQFRWDLVDIDLDDDRVRGQDAVNRATLLRFGCVLARMSLLAGRGDTAALDDAEKQYGAFMGKVFRTGPKVPIASDATGAGGVIPAVPIFRR
jgi:hypothetical protein